MLTVDRNDLENRFTYHPPDDGQAAHYEVLRHQGLLLGNVINELTPDSREKSLAITHVEQAVMWANAAIARNS